MNRKALAGIALAGVLYFVAGSGSSAESDRSAQAAREKAEWTARQLAPLNRQAGIVYKEVDGRRLTLDLFLPAEKPAGRMPFMVFIHGGGWSGGEMLGLLIPVFYESLKTILAHGIACATVDYRLVKRGQSTAYECVVDCRDAVRFLCANAERFGLDPDRLGVWGGSAGGHLSLMTALADNTRFPGDPRWAGVVPKFSCVLAYYPLTTFMVPELHQGGLFTKPGSFRHLTGGTLEEAPDRARLFSPAEYLRPDSPEILLLHGDEDTVLPLAYSTYFKQRADELGARVQLLVVKQARHGFSGSAIEPPMAEINRRAAEFIISHLTAAPPGG